MERPKGLLSLPMQGIERGRAYGEVKGPPLPPHHPMQGIEGRRGPGTAVSSSLCGWEAVMCVLVFELFQNQKIVHQPDKFKILLYGLDCLFQFLNLLELSINITV